MDGPPSFSPCEEEFDLKFKRCPWGWLCLNGPWLGAGIRGLGGGFCAKFLKVLGVGKTFKGDELKSRNKLSLWGNLGEPFVGS